MNRTDEVPAPGSDAPRREACAHQAVSGPKAVEGAGPDVVASADGTLAPRQATFDFHRSAEKAKESRERGEWAAQGTPRLLGGGAVARGGARNRIF